MAKYNIAGVADSDMEVFKNVPAGEYPAEVTESSIIEITREDSKYKGCHMWKPTVRVQDEETGTESTASDLIILPDPDKMSSEDIRRAVAKLARWQVACGLEQSDDFETDDFLHCELTAVVGIKKDEKYGDQNIIRDVLPL